MISQIATSTLDLNLLRYLVVLVQEGSVSRAAHKMLVTQPAVSAALKRLRVTFEDPILVRSGQSMQATPRALEMVRALEPMLLNIQSMAQDHKKFDPASSHMVFTLTCSDYVQFSVMSRLTNAIRRNAPDVSLVVKPANPEKIAHWMESGQVDLGIGYLNDPPEHLRSRMLWGEDQVCLIRKNHPALRRKWTKDLYTELTHVAISPGGAGIYGARIDHALKSEGVKRRVGLTLPSFLAMPYVVAKTDFVATVPASIARHFSSFLPLTSIQLPLTLPAFEISMYWHERVHADVAHKWLRQQVMHVAPPDSQSTL
jgi:DNA-binding transcriptional LysR family regulator